MLTFLLSSLQTQFGQQSIQSSHILSSDCKFKGILLVATPTHPIEHNMSSSSSVAKDRTKKVEISSELNVYQLSSIKQQLEQEIEILSQSVEQLLVLKQRFRESKEFVQRHSQVAAGTEILVPLTSSMYVNGSVKENETFLVDIGTGYYVEKDTKAAVDFFERKVTFLMKEIEKLTKHTQEKVNMRDSILEALSYRQQHQHQVASN